MAKKATPKLDALIFIDTNIFLDFYRFRNSDVSVKFLEQIELHKDILISTKQVEMEFKKNRQSILALKHAELKNSKPENYAIPDILLEDADTEKIIKDANDLIVKERKKIYEKVEAMFSDPKSNDPVFKTIDKIFEHSSTYKLSDIKQSIYNLAKKRFNLGYPPRKSTDNSFGDAINWEWIIECAKLSGKHIIIVTRDNDYGSKINNVPHINDWLAQEFNEKVGPRQQLLITDKLTTAFNLVQITVSSDMIKEEDSVLAISNAIDNVFTKQFFEIFRKHRLKNKNYTISPIDPDFFLNFENNIDSSEAPTE